jgi:hypothetical protein
VGIARVSSSTGAAREISNHYDAPPGKESPERLPRCPYASASTAFAFRGAQGAGDAILSSDIVQSPYSPVFNSQLTAVLEGGLVKAVLRYDSEMGCANRRVELAKQVLVHAHA